MDEIELAVFETFRELWLAVRVFGLLFTVLASKFFSGLTVLARKLLDGLSLGHTGIYGAHKQAHNKKK